MSSISVVVPTLGGPRLDRVLHSLEAQTVTAQVIVVDDGSPHGVDVPAQSGVELLRVETNSGFSHAVNLAASHADGAALVLLNDDCVVDADFLERITAPLDPTGGIAMVASVMRDWAEQGLIDSAGMELDPTLLVWDYLNGEPLAMLDSGVPDPVGPSAAAAAFDRAAYRAAGGFDERLFAYWEDVDLVLRLRREGFRCRLATDARGTHEHSASFGSGTARKNYLTGFGRGYVLRKWRVARPRSVPSILARDAVVCAGQALIDRNLTGVRGRLDGYRAARPTESYPEDLPTGQAPTALGTLRRRLARRRRLRGRRAAGGEHHGLRSIAFFHLAETSGPSRSLERELEWQAELGELEVVVPADGDVASRFGEFAGVTVAGHEAVIRPAGPAGWAAGLVELARDVRRFRSLIRDQRADLVVVVTAMLPAALIAARRERVPAVVYCGEVFEQRGMSWPQLIARRALARLVGNGAAGIAAGSRLVAQQFEGMRCPVVEVVYPPVGEEYAGGDGAAARARLGLDPAAPLVIALGSITAGRGQDVLVRAIAAARRTHPEIRCVIAGAPFDRPADREFAELVAATIDELGQREAVTMPGQVTDVAGLLAAADVFVNPARFDEPFGRAAFEAAMAGAPAIVSRVGAANELFADGRSALLVAPDRPDELAASITRLLDDPDLGVGLVARARAFAERELAPEASVAGWRRVVEGALAGR
jgi:GT2 family glycosyltransferase/glycosyltransferase involved in cell wall biosynthesis